MSSGRIPHSSLKLEEDKVGRKRARQSTSKSDGRLPVGASHRPCGRAPRREGATKELNKRVKESCVGDGPAG